MGRCCRVLRRTTGRQPAGRLTAATTGSGPVACRGQPSNRSRARAASAVCPQASAMPERARSRSRGCTGTRARKLHSRCFVLPRSRSNARRQPKCGAQVFCTSRSPERRPAGSMARTSAFGQSTQSPRPAAQGRQRRFALASGYRRIWRSRCTDPARAIVGLQILDVMV